MRPDEPAENIARYIFLNPYRKSLLKRNARWPGWILSPDADFEFLQQLDTGGCPPHLWLEEPDTPPFPHRNAPSS
jgi:hypothetical protein